MQNGIAQSHSHLKFASLAVHAGQEPDEITGAVIPAISLSTTFKQAGPGQHKVSFISQAQLTVKCCFRALNIADLATPQGIGSKKQLLRWKMVK